MFDFVKRFLNRNSPEAQQARAEADRRAIAPYLPAIAATEVDYIAVRLGEAPPQNPTASRLGGLPWWPVDRKYPTSTDGHPLFLLAQINFAEVPPLEPFPTEGLLQFFISGSGLLNEQEIAGGHFACVHHAALDVAAMSDLEWLKSERMHRSYPLKKPFDARAMKFQIARMPVDPSDYRFERWLPQVFADDNARDFYCDNFKGTPLRLGGYPSFTQEDPRQYGDWRSGQFNLLTADTTDGLMWGDAGVADFFLNEDDLKARDFSRVAMHWDCT